MPDITVSVINASTAVSDDDCRKLVAALQTQVTRDFEPAWRIDAKLVFVGKDQKPAPGTWWLSILDNSDRSIALGYHELTSDGLPTGKCFARTAKTYGHSWTVTASHELLELLVDPDDNLAVLVHPEPDKTVLYAYEVCDACQDDQFAYEIDGIKVCDFVYPAYFQGFHPPGVAKYDHMNLLKGPVPAVLQDGYINALDLGDSKGGWQPISAALLDPARQHEHLRGRVSGRRDKRSLPRSKWQCSTAFK